MQTLSTQTIRFLKHAQSARLSLPRRFRALGLLGQELDQMLTRPSIPGLEGFNAASITQPKNTTLNLALLLDEAVQLVHTQLLPRIRRYRVQVAAIEQLSDAQQVWLGRYFQQQIYPLLTPFAVDSGHPFPFIAGGRLTFLVVLQSSNKLYEETQYGLVQIPNRLPRLVQAHPCLPPPGSRRAKPLRCLLWREEIVRYFLPVLFSGVSVKAVYQFRLLRAPLYNSSPTLMSAEQRTAPVKGPITQLLIEKAMPPDLQQWLVKRLQVSMERVLACSLPLGLADLCELADHLSLPQI